jgi:hypothetical protein
MASPAGERPNLQVSLPSLLTQQPASFCVASEAGLTFVLSSHRPIDMPLFHHFLVAVSKHSNGLLCQQCRLKYILKKRLAVQHSPEAERMAGYQFGGVYCR